jgi:Putative DNA-binding domain
MPSCGKHGVAMNELLAQLYRGISSATDVQQMADDKRPEDLYLEFKEKRDRSDDRLHDDDRQGFAEALSGFANSDGGVLLFGMATKKHGGSIDKADKVKPIANAEQFCGRLKSYVLSATSPPVDGVTLGFIPSDGADGYVKCLVPPSDRPPHMVMREHLYYRRSVDSFRVMEHFELEDMFGRRPRPVLELHITLEPTAQPPKLPVERLWFGLKNEGRSIAKYAGIHCELRDSSITAIQTGSPLADWSRMNGGRWTVGYAEAAHVHHPNGIIAYGGEARIVRTRAGENLPLAVSFYADRADVQRFELDLKPGTTMALGKAGQRVL